MSVYDIIFLAVLGLSLLIGFFKGVEKSLARLVEVILTLAVSALAAMCVIWLGLVDLDALTPAIEAMDVNAIIKTGVIFVPVAFIVMFIVSVLIGDYLYNKFVYRKRTFKSAMLNRGLGALCYFTLCLVIVCAINGVLYSLEGTEYDVYAAIMTDSVVLPVFDKINPLRSLIGGIIVDNGLVSVIVGILNMLWPNFEYLSMMI